MEHLAFFCTEIQDVLHPVMKRTSFRIRGRSIAGRYESCIENGMKRIERGV